MEKKNIIFIAQSIDGYIADKNGAIDWLESVPNPGKLDLGWAPFMKDIDAIIMGRVTYETVCGFDIPWPYDVPVYVLSNSLNKISKGKDVNIVKGKLADVIKDINNKGYNKLYIDGGNTITSFLKEDLINEMIITTIPVLLGGGAKLFGNFEVRKDFKLEKSTLYLGEIFQAHYIRKR